MIKKLMYTTTALTCFLLILLSPLFLMGKQRIIVKMNTEAKKTITLKQSFFEELPGWSDTEVKTSLEAFQKSCKTFLKQDPHHPVGSKFIKLEAQDWIPACQEALTVNDATQSRAFFERWFYPVELSENTPSQGLFTGYYMPQIEGSLTKTAQFDTPIYAIPSDLKTSSSKKNYYTRAEIDNGKLGKKAAVIAWIKSPVDRLFLEIEGSGVIHLSNGKRFFVGYAGENGAPYTSIGNILIKKGVLTKDNASQAAIKHYLERLPKKGNSIIQQNKSFVFFHKLDDFNTLGAQGRALTPGYSLAIDRKWIPMGAPLWLTTAIPDNKSKSDLQFQRLMIAQDTGGAIKGLIRGDIYWGAGERATYLGKNMKNEGRYWLLLPKTALGKLAKSTQNLAITHNKPTHTDTFVELMINPAIIS